MLRARSTFSAAAILASALVACAGSHGAGTGGEHTASTGSGHLGGSGTGAGSSTGGSSTTTTGGTTTGTGGTTTGTTTTGTTTTGTGAGTPGTLPPGASSLAITAAGHMRAVTVYAPAAVKSGPLPLVVALHGNGDTSANFVAALGLQSLADQRGFVLAAPQGITQSFTYLGQPLNGIDWDAYRPDDGTNIDLPLLEGIQQQLLATGSIDPKRIVSFGYSQGGYMSFRWGMASAVSLACAGVVAACDPLPGFGLVTMAARKIPVSMQIGTQDWNISGAQATHTELTQNGNPLSYVEIQGAGHVPFPGPVAPPLDWCLGKSL